MQSSEQPLVSLGSGDTKTVDQFLKIPLLLSTSLTSHRFWAVDTYSLSSTYLVDEIHIEFRTPILLLD